MATGGTSNAFTRAEFDAVKLRAETDYATYLEVDCPFLKRKVSFNAKGLDHIKLKQWNHARNQKDQYIRLKLVHLAPKVIKQSNTLQGLKEGNKFERIKVNSRWEFKMVFVRYYEFIAIVNGCRVRVIVKQIDNGPPYFWSIIPYWKQSVTERRMHEGNPEED